MRDPQDLVVLCDLCYTAVGRDGTRTVARGRKDKSVENQECAVIINEGVTYPLFVPRILILANDVKLYFNVYSVVSDKHNGDGVWDARPSI